jgi:sorbitol-specific phosphotransferase system component IIC
MLLLNFVKKGKLFSQSMKAKKIITIIVTTLAALMVIFSGIVKLSGSMGIADTLAKVGVQKYIIYLGLAEILFAALFIYPKTMKIGFILLSCYFAGALATEVSHGTPLNALTPIILVWIAAFLRDKSIFL